MAFVLTMGRATRANACCREILAEICWLSADFTAFPKISWCRAHFTRKNGWFVKVLTISILWNIYIFWYYDKIVIASRLLSYRRAIRPQSRGVMTFVMAGTAYNRSVKTASRDDFRGMIGISRRRSWEILSCFGAVFICFNIFISVIHLYRSRRVACRDVIIPKVSFWRKQSLPVFVFFTFFLFISHFEVFYVPICAFLQKEKVMQHIEKTDIILLSTFAIVIRYVIWWS